MYSAAYFRWIVIVAVFTAPVCDSAHAQQPAVFGPVQPTPPTATQDLPSTTPPLGLVGETHPAPRPGLQPEGDLKTWWHDQLMSPIGPPEEALPMELERAVVRALATSARVSILRDTADISATAIPQAEATFDPVSFLDTRFTDTSDPVGSTLTTGGTSRFIDRNWYSSGGLRKQFLTGSQVEATQRLGFENSNSTFFVPQDQATAKLMLNVTQPLLRGAGYAYNNGIVVLANVDAGAARSQFIADVQSYLVELHGLFWDIYLQRAVLLQRRRLLQEARDILAELEARRDVDVQISQLARARAAVGNREASLLRYGAAVKDAASRFKALVNDPYLDNPNLTELVPLDSPDAAFGDADLTTSLTTALDHRPEIDVALQEVRAAAQKLDLAKNEVLPMLNLMLGSYVYGLQGQTNFGDAIASQFNTGRPTYWAGLLYERPLGNRAARAVREQRILELQRATSKLRGITANVRAEVEIAVREISTTRGEMLSRHQAMLAEAEQVNFLLQRWRLLAGDQQVAGVMFNDLLDAQDRRAAAEFEFVSSQVAHRIAWVKLWRATGTLCDCSALTSSDLAPVTMPSTEPPVTEMVPIPAEIPTIQTEPSAMVVTPEPDVQSVPWRGPTAPEVEAIPIPGAPATQPTPDAPVIVPLPPVRENRPR